MTWYVQTAIIFLTAFSVAILLIPRLASIATKIGLVDYPNDRRKTHKQVTPLVGGLGMVLAFVFTCLLYIPSSGMRGFFAGVVLLFIVGFLDDFRELGHRWKFVAQIVAASFMMYYSDVYLRTFGNLLYFGDINFGIFVIPVTIFCTVGITNAINMIDGLDGLAGGVSLIAFITFTILSYIGGYRDYFFVSLALCGVTLGFLRYNWRPARVFMGDAGSLFLGFCLVYLSIIITQAEGSVIRPVIPLLILTVPITDTLTLMSKRALARKSPFHADSYHLHHILIRMGLTKIFATMSILFLSVIFAAIAVLGTIYRVPDYYLFLLFMVYFTLYFIASFYLKQILRLVFLKRQGLRRKA